MPIQLRADLLYLSLVLYDPSRVLDLSRVLGKNAGKPADSLAAVAYRYKDYFADVMAMNLPASGASVREHYMSANN